MVELTANPLVMDLATNLVVSLIVFPIVREPHGIVGAICMNIDTNYIRDQVLSSPEATAAFFRHYCTTDMRLEENILSRPEYEKALAGKRHWRDEAPAA